GMILGGWYETNQNSGEGIVMAGPGSVISYNTITNTGHHAIRISNTDNLTASYNFISNFGMTKYDAGGIYSYNGDSTINKHRYIENNIIVNSNQISDGINGGGLSEWGVYLDGFSNHTFVINNSIYNCYTGGMIV